MSYLSISNYISFLLFSSFLHELPLNFKLYTRLYLSISSSRTWPAFCMSVFTSSWFMLSTDTPFTWTDLHIKNIPRDCFVANQSIIKIKFVFYKTLTLTRLFIEKQYCSIFSSILLLFASHSICRYV
jgi:hypothetical protein